MLAQSELAPNPSVCHEKGALIASRYILPASYDTSWHRCHLLRAHQVHRTNKDLETKSWHALNQTFLTEKTNAVGVIDFDDAV